MSNTYSFSSWTYDTRGRMTRESKIINGSGTFVTQWAYNSADLANWMQYPADNAGGLGERDTTEYYPQK